MCCPLCCTAADFGTHEFCSGPLTGICCGKPFADDQERISWRLVPREVSKLVGTQKRPGNEEYVKAQNVVYADKMKDVMREKEVKVKKEKEMGKGKGEGKEKKAL